MARGLGRVAPKDWVHYERFPLTLATTPSQPVPVIWGINWYENFDYPQLQSNGEYWIGQGDLGPMLGGHCIAQPYYGAGDLRSWYLYYDQGLQGACVGYAWSRAMSWLNRRKYDADWLYQEAKEADEWPGEDYEGTSVRAGARALMGTGHRRVYNGVSLEPSLTHGIAAFRWVNNVEDVLNVVGGEAKRRGAITWRNSWGHFYPQKVWIPGEVAQRLIDEEGEIAIPTDR